MSRSIITNEAAVQARSPERPSDAPRSSLGLAPCAMLYDKHSLRCPNVVPSSTRPLQDVVYVVFTTVPVSEV